MMNSEKELISYLKTKNKIIIYGAGMVGGLVKNRLDSNRLQDKIQCFAKTKCLTKEEYMGVGVRGLDALLDVDEDTCILVCALSATQEEMIYELDMREIHNYVAISDELFLDMQENYLKEQQIANPGMVSKIFDVIFFSQDNNATSGAFISMVGLCDAIQQESSLRILVVLPRYGDGEALLRENNLEFTYVNREKEWIMRADVKPERLYDTYSFYDKQEVERLRELIRSTGARLVHISGMFVFAGALAAREEGIPVIWHIRENIMTQGNRFINEKASYELINASRAVVCVSKHVSRAYKELDGDIVRIIYNGADEYKFYKERAIFNSEICKIVMVGHITPLKGQEVLIRALEYLKDNKMPIPYVTFVGGGDSDYLEYLIQLIMKVGVDEYVNFAGRTPNPEEYYQQADMAISATSGGEGFDRVRIEAMLSGCLLITNDMGAAREVVKNGETGYLYESGNMESLAEVIMNAAQDIELSKIVAARGQALCIEKFTKRCNAKQVLELYREIMGEHYGK